MASAAEQLAANLNFGALAKSEDLKKRIWFTLGALIVYRLGSYIPIPGIDAVELAKFAAQNSTGILGWVNNLAGGAWAAWRSSPSTSCPTSRPRSSSS